MTNEPFLSHFPFRDSAYFRHTVFRCQEFDWFFAAPKQFVSKILAKYGLPRYAELNPASVSVAVIHKIRETMSL